MWTSRTRKQYARDQLTYARFLVTLTTAEREFSSNTSAPKCADDRAHSKPRARSISALRRFHNLVCPKIIRCHTQSPFVGSGPFQFLLLLALRCRRTATGYRSAPARPAVIKIITVTGLALEHGTPRLVMTEPRR